MIGNSFSFSVTQSHTYSRIRNTTRTIDFRSILLSHLHPTGETYFLYITPFITRCRETIVHPQKRTNLHTFIGFAQLCHAISTQVYNLTRTKIFFYFVIKIRKTTRLTRGSICPLFLTNHNRCTPPSVTGGNNTIFCQQKHRAGPFDVFVYILDTFNKSFSLDDE